MLKAVKSLSRCRGFQPAVRETSLLSDGAEVRRGEAVLAVRARLLRRREGDLLRPLPVGRAEGEEAGADRRPQLYGVTPPRLQRIEDVNERQLLDLDGGKAGLAQKRLQPARLGEAEGPRRVRGGPRRRGAPGYRPPGG